MSYDPSSLFYASQCSIIPDILGNDSRYYSITNTDSAGTKASLAYVYWKETGDITVWENIAHDTIIMNLDELYTLGASGPFLLYYTVGRNKNFITNEVLESILYGVKKTIQYLQTLDISIHYAGHRINELGDLTRTALINSMMTTRLKKDQLIDKTTIQKDDLIIGLSSDGQTQYENTYHSGIGNHGLTTARHELLHHTVAQKYPESFDSSLPSFQTYAGDYRLTDEIEDLSHNIGQLLLCKTRTYVPVLQKIFHEYKSHIHGIVHCTDGGQVKALYQLKQPLHIVKDKLFPIPIIFQLIQCKSNISWQTMYQTFNMGHRMEMYVKAAVVEPMLKMIVQTFGLNAKVIGKVTFATKKQLTIQKEQDIYQFNA